jgi:hypothetical protein
MRNVGLALLGLAVLSLAFARYGFTQQKKHNEIVFKTCLPAFDRQSEAFDRTAKDRLNVMVSWNPARCKGTWSNGWNASPVITELTPIKEAGAEEVNLAFNSHEDVYKEVETIIERAETERRWRRNTLLAGGAGLALLFYGLVVLLVGRGHVA